MEVMGSKNSAASLIGMSKTSEMDLPLYFTSKVSLL